MIKGLLFDKDGTLLEFQQMWHEIISRIFITLEKEYGVYKDTIDKIKQISGYEENGFVLGSIIQYSPTSKIAEIWSETIHNERNLDVPCITNGQIIKLFDDIASSDDIKIQPIEGVVELLKNLKNRGYTLGVATADTYLSTYKGLKKAGILEFFDYIGCNEEGILPKPYADMAYRFCEGRDFTTSEIVIVGDSVTDMEFAMNANANFIGIKTSYNNYEAYENFHEASVENVQDILRYL